MAIERPTRERIAQALGDFVETTIVSIDVLADGTERQVDVLVIQMLDGHLLTKLSNRGVLDLKQLSAALRFLKDCNEAGILSGAVVDPGRIVVDGGNSVPAQERQADAYARVHAILTRVSPSTKAVLVDIVLFEMTREAFARKHQIPNKDEKDINLVVNSKIQDALTDLDYRYYGQQKTQNRFTHSPDYRPIIQAPQNTA